MRKMILAGVVMMLAGAAFGQTTAPATQPNSVVDKLNTMPKELWPVKGETTARVQARQKWVETAFTKGTTLKGITGSLEDSEEKTIPVFNPGPRPSGARGVKPDSYKSVQAVRLTAKTVEVWGVLMTINIRARVDVPATTAQGWTKQQPLSLDGPVDAVLVSKNDVSIDLGLCALTPPLKYPAHPTPKPTTAPAAQFPKTGSQL